MPRYDVIPPMGDHACVTMPCCCVHALQRGLLEVRVHFDLIHRGHDGRFAQEAIEVLGHEVAHADRAHLAVREQLLERAVRVERALERRRQRLVQEQQVELLDAELADALVERVQRGVVAVVADPDLRLDEDLVAGDAGATNAFADLALVGVRGRGVDQPVAGCEGRFDGATVVGRRALKDAEAEGRQFDAVVQRDCWDGVDARRSWCVVLSIEPRYASASSRLIGTGRSTCHG